MCPPHINPMTFVQVSDLSPARMLPEWQDDPLHASPES